MNIFLEFIYAFFATISFAVIFQVPKRVLTSCGIVGAAGWVTYSVLLHTLGSKLFCAYFVASLVVTFLAEFFAQVKKEPATIFIATGIIPLVPGLALFQGVSTIVSGSEDFSKLCEAGSGSIAIALGVMLISSILHYARQNKN